MIEIARAKSALATAAAKPPLGDLPTWNLSDLYRGMDDPKLREDLRRAETDAAAFEEKYKGKIVAIAGTSGGGSELAEAVAAFERLEELLGRIVSYAGLVHAEDTSDSVARSSMATSPRRSPLPAPTCCSSAWS